MKNWVTKKNIFVASLLGLVSTIALGFLDARHASSCEYITKEGPVIGHAIKYCEYIALSLLPLVAMLPISLLSFYLKEELFRVWIRFAKWWVPFFIFMILVAPVETGGWISLPIKGSIALVSSVLFIFISLILIAYKSFALRKKG